MSTPGQWLHQLELQLQEETNSTLACQCQWLKLGSWRNLKAGAFAPRCNFISRDGVGGAIQQHLHLRHCAVRSMVCGEYPIPFSRVSGSGAIYGHFRRTVFWWSTGASTPCPTGGTSWQSTHKRRRTAQATLSRQVHRTVPVSCPMQ